jgi:hypothetical protein
MRTSCVGVKLIKSPSLIIKFPSPIRRQSKRKVVFEGVVCGKRFSWILVRIIIALDKFIRLFLLTSECGVSTGRQSDIATCRLSYDISSPNPPVSEWIPNSEFNAFRSAHPHDPRGDCQLQLLTVHHSENTIPHFPHQEENWILSRSQEELIQLREWMGRWDGTDGRVLRYCIAFRVEWERERVTSAASHVNGYVMSANIAMSGCKMFERKLKCWICARVEKETHTRVFCNLFLSYMILLQ